MQNRTAGPGAGAGTSGLLIRHRERTVNDEELRTLAEMMPFALACDIRIESASKETVRASMPWAPERCTAAGILHGGALMTLADSSAAICAYLNLPEGASTSTIESKTNFFRAVRSGDVHTLSRPLHSGRTTIVVQTDIVDEDASPVAHVVQTQAVLNPSA